MPNITFLKRMKKIRSANSRKELKNLKNLSHFLLLTLAVLFQVACKKGQEPQETRIGKIRGIVTDAGGEPISGVKVTLSGIKEEDRVTISGDDGSYVFENVPFKTYAVTFSKDGWLAVSLTVTAAKFGDAGVANADMEMVNASAKIVGTVVDIQNDNEPLSGVTVSVGGAVEPVITESDGSFVINNLIEKDYNVTFRKEGYTSVDRDVLIADFTDGVATLEVQMGSEELLRGL